MKTPMKKSTKIIMIAAAVVVVAVIAVVGFLGVNHKLNQNEYIKQMEEAEKYLSVGDEDNAILAYEKAIDINPKDAKAYEQLATIYIGREDYVKAEYYLNLGVQRATDTGTLRYMLSKKSTWRTTLETEVAEEEEDEEESEDQQFKVSGTIIDAVTGSGVPDAHVSAVRTDNKKISCEQPEATSKANGAYELKLPAGSYTVTVELEAYILESFDLEVKDREIKNMNYTISPELAQGEIRIVLEWGATPSDLDAYLFEGSVSDQSPVFFGNKGSDSKGAVLDVDDRNGYGPETITIKNTSKTWIYGVMDFTESETGLANSGVTVKVYVPGQDPRVYTAPSGNGDYWTVLKISNGHVSDISKHGDSWMQ